jgi:hypothetical protein
MSEPIEVARVTITKHFNDDADGGTSVSVSYSADLPLIDALGMLAFAQWVTPREYLAAAEEEEEE